MNNWTEENNKLKKEFTFASFIEAFGFLAKVAVLAEKANHHPTIVNTYSKVTLYLTTHDEGNKITDKDRDLAGLIDELT